MLDTFFSPLENNTSCIIFYVGMIFMFFVLVATFILGLSAILTLKIKIPFFFIIQWFYLMLYALITYLMQRTLYSMCAKTPL
jgi:hypothetical protein